MRHGWIRAAAATPYVKVADPQHNRDRILELMREGEEKKTDIMVFPELCLTAYTCGDLFGQDALLRGAKRELYEILKASADMKLLAFIGLPWEYGGRLYNAAAAVQGGRLLGLVTKTNLPNYSEFYEKRYFEPGPAEPVEAPWKDGAVPMGANLLFCCDNVPGLVVAGEICEDVWVTSPPSIRHVAAGATVIVNCSASDENTGKDIYRRSLIDGQSARLICGYVYANAGEGESSQDLVFGGHNIISEDGVCLAESKRFTNDTVYVEIDLERLLCDRRRLSTFPAADRTGYRVIRFSAREEIGAVSRRIDPAPFVPAGQEQRSRRCEEILTIQAMGLKKRLEHTGCRHVVIGVSGGLDSALALLVAVKAFDLLNIPREQIHTVTMPCFGTTDRTYQNACQLAEELGTELTEIPIRDAVLLHFKDIGQDPDVHDVTYENSQARERTQVLMDVANQKGGMVVGTGDMSELALGWATYNGDHMSMYGVNASVPKTLVRHLVRYYADTCGIKTLRDLLLDVLDTPVSPELLPPENGVIAQKTEELVGPYELHDFFLYYVLRFGYSPAKIYYLARLAFDGVYDGEIVLKWLKVFYRRFFSQQFKRSCLPDGPKVGSVSVSPRGDLRMPSDACSRLWLEELDTLT